MFDLLEILEHPAWRGIGGFFAFLSLLAYLIAEKENIFTFSEISHYKNAIFKFAVFILYVVVSLVFAILPHLSVAIHIEYIDNDFYGILFVIITHIFSLIILFFTFLLIEDYMKEIWSDFVSLPVIIYFGVWLIVSFIGAFVA